jgi:hypothetical protein
MSMINVGCELRYNVTAPTSFLFNVAVAHTAHQMARQERFTVTPGMRTPSTTSAARATASSVFRPKPVLTLRYQATVGSRRNIDDPPTIRESDHPSCRVRLPHSEPESVL